MAGISWKSINRRKRNFEHEGLHSLNRVLGVKDLTAMGIAAIIGAGIFSTVGNACFDGGPAVIILFIITAIASAFSALCYAEFATRIPVSGSAYTYAYATFGEFAAWIIGWALILEYSIGNIAVAQSWSGYFTTLVNALLANFGKEFPVWLSVNYTTAKIAFNDAIISGNTELTVENLPLRAWFSAPQFLGFRCLVDLPAIAITVAITWLVYRGVKESKNVNNWMVVLKLGIILLVIGIGSFYVKPENWHPFMPNGFGGVMTGISAVFFAYIGFDAISTTAEECKNPARDLPRGMFYSLAICTVLYILITLVLTGMSNYKTLNVMDPLAFVFEQRGFSQLGGFISASAVVALTGVLLVFQMGQPRIWLSMSRDGLLPKAFSKVHPKYKTPSFSTIITGVLVGVPLLFFSTGFSVDFTSIGTLFAFLLVCAGTLLLPEMPKKPGQYSMPSISGRFIVPTTYLLMLILLQLNGFELSSVFSPIAWKSNPSAMLNGFIILFGVVAALTFVYRWKFVPVAGVLMCSYLLTGMTPQSWYWFFGWFILGICVYFLYSFKRSKLNSEKER